MGAKGKSLGGAKLTIAGNASELAPHENPLVRNETLKQMYQKMVESRLLEEHTLRGSRKVKHARHELAVGLEACWVGVLQGATVGDVVMDSRGDGLTGHLLGTKLPVVLGEPTRTASAGQAAKMPAAGVLPFLHDAEQRLFAAVGAGLLLKSTQRKKVLIVYLRSNEVAKRVWVQVLTRSAELNLPVIFVVLPAATKQGIKEGSRVCGWAHKGGVPGIPVDANDAVALHRVAQESMGRIRGDGGPVLISCVPFHAKNDMANGGADPIELLKGFMLGRKVAPAAWMDSVEKRFKLKLKVPEKAG